MLTSKLGKIKTILIKVYYRVYKYTKMIEELNHLEKMGNLSDRKEFG